MNELFIMSKVYIVPKEKPVILYLILNICIVVTSMLSLVSVILMGINFRNISSIIIAFYIVFKVKKLFKIEPYYQFSVVNIMVLEENIVFKYDIGRMIVLRMNSVESVEYSNRLQCMRFVGDYTVNDNENSQDYYRHEYLFYVNENEYPDFFELIKRSIKKDIIYVDNL